MPEMRRGGRGGITQITNRSEEPHALTTQCSENGPKIMQVKGKANPLQAWSGPEGSRKLRFPDFVTTTQDGGQVVSLTHRPPLPPGNAPGTHFQNYANPTCNL